jgi:hypothetical protein
MNGRSRNRFGLWLSCLILALGITACADVKVNTLPPPPPTAKLRVFFLPVSDALPGRQYWSVSHKDFSRNMAQPLIRYLRATGIYTMVPPRDVSAVLTGQNTERILWQRNDWGTARKVGRALHADYVVVTRRGYQGFFFFQMLWINLETGKVFESKDHPGTFLQGAAKQDEFRRIVRQTYREIFQQAKGDLLATAIRKGRTMERPGTPPQGPAKRPEPAVTPAPKPPPPPPVQEAPPPQVIATKPVPETPGPAGPTKPPAPALVEEAPAPPPPAVEASPAEPEEVAEEAPPAAEAAVKEPPAPGPAASVVAAGPPPAVRPPRPALPPLLETAPTSGKTRLVVYDLETTQPMQVAGLILTEALREEIHKLGSFDLVNREDLTRALEELKLQQSGLVREKEAVQMGRWLAARQSVTGRLGSLGSTTVLSTKRTDIETMGTLSIGSLKAPAGREEDLLNGLPDLAKKLIQKQ